MEGCPEDRYLQRVQNINNMDTTISDEQREVIEKLRNETGRSLMDCKKALIASDWNYEEAKKEVILKKETFFLY